MASDAGEAFAELLDREELAPGRRQLDRLLKIERAAQALIMDWVATGNTTSLGKLRDAVEDGA